MDEDKVLFAKRVFRSLGNEGRLKILLRLSEGEALTGTQLSKEFDMKRGLVSEGLRCLELCGLVRMTSKVSSFRLYEITPFGQEASEWIRSILEGEKND